MSLFYRVASGGGTCDPGAVDVLMLSGVGIIAAGKMKTRTDRPGGVMPAKTASSCGTAICPVWPRTKLLARQCVSAGGWATLKRRAILNHADVVLQPGKLAMVLCPDEGARLLDAGGSHRR